MCSSPHWQVGSSWFREKLSPANRNKGYRGEQISRKIVSRELNARSYRDFAKILRSWAPRLQNSRNRWAKKWGPTCDRDISNSAIYTTAIYRAYTVYDNVLQWWWCLLQRLLMTWHKEPGHQQQWYSSLSPKRFNTLWPCDTIWRHKSGSILGQVKANCRYDGTKPLPEPMLIYHQRRSVALTWDKFHSDCQSYYSV